jgi:hypothetical protein
LRRRATRSRATLSTRNGPEVGASVASRREATGRGLSVCSGSSPVRVRLTKPALGAGRLYTIVSGSGVLAVTPLQA